MSVLFINGFVYSWGRYTKKSVLVVVLMLMSYSSFSQCTNTVAYGSATAPSNGASVTITTLQYATEYATISSVAASTVYQSTSSIATDYLTVRKGTYDGTVIASGVTPLTWTSTGADTYYVHCNTNASCGTTSTNRTTTISNVIAVPSSGSNSITACSGHIYDNGGPSGAYVANSNGYSVIYPSTAGNLVQLTGSYYSEASYDYIYIYNGVGTGGSLLYSGSASSSTSIGTITSTDPTGALTIRFTSNGTVQNSGFDFTIACVPPPPGENCSNAQNLASLTSPYSATTTSYADDISTCRTGYPDRVFYINVPNNYTIDIWESVNYYDEYEYMGWGGSCPGANTINCWDNDALAHNTWVNTTGSTQTVWYIQDGYNGAGDFTLNWTLVAACNAPTSISANASSTTVCPGSSVTFQYSTSSGGYCLGANTWEYQWENTSGGVVRAWSTTANYTTTISAATTYRLRMRCSGCTSSTFLSNDVTVNVYSVSSTIPTLSSPANSSAVTSSPTTLSWTGSLGNHPNSRYEVQLNGGSWTSTGSSTSYSASLNVGANTWTVRYYDGCSGAYYTTGSRTVYYTPVSSCGNVDHGGNNWTISSNTTVSGNHTNVGTFTINNGVTATVDAACHYFNVEATTISILGVINGNGAGAAGGSGGNGGAQAYNSPDDYCNGGYGGFAGSAGQGTGGGAAGTNGGNATCVDQICGNILCIGNKDGHDGGGGGAGGGAGGSYGGTGAGGAVAARGTAGGGASGGLYGSGGSYVATYGTATGTDISWGSGGAGAGGGGGAYTNGFAGFAGGAGGGQVSLKATQTLTISGSVTCNGANGNAGGDASGNSNDNAYDCNSSGYNECDICTQKSFDYAGGAGGAGGAGSGGGILIQSCGALSFTGSLTANGGTGGGAALPNTNNGTCFDWARGGAGGGGGRIKIFRNPCETATISGSITANAGAGGSSSDGHTGNVGSAGSVQTAINHPSYVVLTGGTITADQTICTGGNPDSFSSTSTPTGGNCAQSYSYQWMKCTSGCGSAPTNYTDVSGATAITFDEGVITQTTYYVRKVTSGNCTAYTSSIIATVVPDPAAPTATKSPNTASACEGQTLTLINPVDNGGGTGSCQINYRYSSTLAGLPSAAWSTSIPSTTAVAGNYYIEMQKGCSGSGCDASPITQYSWVVNTNSVAPTSITGTSTICNGGSTTLSVNGGSLGTGASWKWYSGSCGGTFVGTGSDVTVSPISTTTYYARAEGTCNSTSCASITVTVVATPTNDLCANATLIASLPYSSGVQTNNCATNDAPAAGSSSCGVHDYNVWYKYTGNGNQINISTCDASTTFDTEIHVYTGSCGSMTEVICSDNGVDAGCTAGRSSLTMCTSNGTTYYISVGSYILSATTGNYVLSISDKAIGAATITPNSICENGTVTLTANVGANADAVDFSINGGSTVANTDASTPYQYTTASLTAPQAVTVHVRSKNSISGCVGSWTNAADANAYSLPTVTVQPLCNNGTGRKIELIGAGGSTVYSTYEQQSPSVSHASNVFAVPFGITRSFKVTDDRGCASSWFAYSAPVEPSQISGVATGSCIVRGQNDWWHITDASNQVILSVQDNSNDLGFISAWSYIEPSATTYNDRYYLKRHFKVASENAPSSNVTLRLYFTEDELNELIANSNSSPNIDDDVDGISDLIVTKYSGINEDGIYANNDFGCAPCFNVYTPSSGNATGYGVAAKYIEFSVPSFSEQWIHGNKSNVTLLPIELVSMNAICVGENRVIKWMTASEANNDYFEVQRSANGIDFENFARVNGSGNSSDLLEYSIVDDLKSTGIVYYRLKQVDFNGDSHLFDIVSSDCIPQTSPIGVVPNPFKNKISITGLSDEIVQIELINSFGSVLYKNSINATNSSDIYFGNLSPGIYLLRLVNTDGSILNFKIVKS